MGWVGLHQHHTSTDMVPSEGEDGVGWPGLCSLDRGASRRPMIGNQIAAHPSPSSCHRCRLTLRFRDSPPPRPLPPSGIPRLPTIHPYSRPSQPYPELTPLERTSLSRSPSLSLTFPTTLFSSPTVSLSFSLAPSRRSNFGLPSFLLRQLALPHPHRRRPYPPSPAARRPTRHLPQGR